MEGMYLFFFFQLTLLVVRSDNFFMSHRWPMGLVLTERKECKRESIQTDTAFILVCASSAVSESVTYTKSPIPFFYSKPFNYCFFSFFLFWVVMENILGCLDYVTNMCFLIEFVLSAQRKFRKFVLFRGYN